MSLIYTRKATTADYEAVSHLIELAREVLKNDGSSQWQDGHPSEAEIRAGIEDQECYVLIRDAEIVGTAVLLSRPDPDYDTIYNGTWRRPEETYAAIHRVAVHPDYKGQKLSKFLFANLISLAAEKGFHQIRIDTHQANKRMQHVLNKLHFEYRGEVYVGPGEAGKRLAYQLFLRQ